MHRRIAAPLHRCIVALLPHGWLLSAGRSDARAKNLGRKRAMIAKALLSTLLRKKARTLLLLFSIAACASLMFANSSFQRTVGEIVYEKSVRYSGNADIVLAAKQSVGAEEWIDAGLLAPYAEQIEYAQELVQGKALHVPGSADAGGGGNSAAGAGEQRYFTVLGTDIDEFNARNPLALQSGSVENWAGGNLVIGAAFAERLGVAAGDTLPLEIGGVARDFRIAGVSQPKGLFTRDVADGGYLLVPRETLSGILGGRCNLIFVKAADPSAAVGLKQALAEAMPQYSVNLGVDRAVIQAETDNFAMPFWFSSISVIFMSVFIIYTSFNLIVDERIKILGILRSAGCSRRKANRILIAESVAVGLAGGAVGCALGVAVLHLVKAMFFGANPDIEDGPAVFGLCDVALTLGLSAALTALSAMLPILKTTRMPVKNIIFNDYQKQKIKSDGRWWVGAVLLAPVAVVPFAAGRGFAGMVAASLALVSALAGLNMAIPAACRLAARAFRGAPQAIALGVRNAGDFRPLVNSARLFATTIAIMAVMAALFNTLASDLRDGFRRHPYDIQVELRESGQQTLEALSGIEGVSACYGEYQTWGSLPDYGTFINGLVGVGGADYFDFFHADVPPEAAAALDSLKGNEMVTTYVFRDKLGLKLGDVLAVQLDEGVFEYAITGFVGTNWGIGHMGYISAETYKSDLGASNYTGILVKASGDPAAVKNNILRAFSKDVLAISTKREIEAANADKVEGVFSSLNAYMYLAMLIGLLGIANNMAACFMGRRRNLAMYRCVGMSRKSAGRMLAAEAATVGAVGMLAGLAAGILSMGAIPHLVGAFWGDVAVAVPAANVAAICGAGTAAMLLCSLIPLAKGRNISIMDNIRYE
jgi:putative ABC transport system permease protein